jgi:hypothetical protein
MSDGAGIVENGPRAADSVHLSLRGDIFIGKSALVRDHPERGDCNPLGVVCTNAPGRAGQLREQPEYFHNQRNGCRAKAPLPSVAADDLSIHLGACWRINALDRH